MRLLEPINGIKTMQGHYMVNIIFFFVIFTVDKCIDTNLRDLPAYDIARLHEHYGIEEGLHSHLRVGDESSYNQYLSQFNQENAMNDEDYVVLNAHGESEGHDSFLTSFWPEDPKQSELKLLHIL